MFVETFTQEEQRRLVPYVTNCDSPVFALQNLSQVVMGAAFARYSRTGKGLRRVLLDEFLGDSGQVALKAGQERAGRLYTKVFQKYGDDSVNQLGGVHVACEGVSNILTKILEWGRLAAYLEQSTRFVDYGDMPGGKYRYIVPTEIRHAPELAGPFEETVIDAFRTYSRLGKVMLKYFRTAYPGDDRSVDYRQALRAKALDAVRGLLPAATTSNLGIFASGQALENMLLRLQSYSDDTEAYQVGNLILREVRKVSPDFVARVDKEDRGIVTSRYLADCRCAMRDFRVTEPVRGATNPFFKNAPDEFRQLPVSLLDWDPSGEIKVIAAMLFSDSTRSEFELRRAVTTMTPDQRANVFWAYVGKRLDRRHKPGRAFERTRYRFELLGPYAEFRDLQRHRMLTLEWQKLTTDHGYEVPDAIQDAGGSVAEEYDASMRAGQNMHDMLRDQGFVDAAQYAVPMQYRVRYYMDMNARALMHVAELRTTRQGHPGYRKVAQTMHDLVRDQAGHKLIADSMCFVDHSTQDGRLEALKKYGVGHDVGEDREADHGKG